MSKYLLIENDIVVGAYNRDQPDLGCIEVADDDPRFVHFMSDPEVHYTLKRQRAYPSMGDQLDALMKWVFSETEITLPAELISIAAQCMAVKSHHPKDA